MTVLVGAVAWGARMRKTFLALLLSGCAVLLFSSGVFWGRHTALREAARAALGADSPWADAAAMAIDHALKFGTAAEKAALKEGISQCRNAIDQAKQALDTCNSRLGIIITAHDQARREATQRAAERAAEEQKLVVRYQHLLGTECADWAAQPICPALRVEQKP